jgi:hypothetical protein
MFTDANVRIDPSAVAALRRYFADRSIGCVCSHLSYINASQSATAAVGSAFWSVGALGRVRLEGAKLGGADDTISEFRRKARIACECMHVHFGSAGISWSLESLSW